MSEIRSDNRLEKHPKPVQEYERKFVSAGVYVDWDSFAEMEAVYNIAYRANKYFWVDGVYYECSSIGVYRPISGSPSTGNSTIIDVIPVADASTIIVPALAGFTFMLAVKGAVPYNRAYIGQTGSTLDFTAVGGVTAGERITIFYI